MGKVKVMAKRVRVEYTLYGSRDEVYAGKYHNEAGEKVLWEGELDFTLQKYEHLYIKELDLEVQIKEISKQTDGIVYYTNVTEEFEDERTEESRIEAERDAKNHNLWIQEKKEALKEERLMNRIKKKIKNLFS
ncbi:gp632 [Bacillus phage G]|uniref:Gp632 n=1 Tax=Bacillus phage G TaxID=2884420 RepID=G3MB12_9CAUD|nr:gp632 [Bacillus phage G]AEO93877.1 gp632 [Bacillus phage G]